LGHARNKPTKKQRILIVRRPPWYAGAEAREVNWLRAIDYEKSMVWMASSKDVFSGPIGGYGLPVECIPIPPELSVKGNPIRVFFSWLRFFRRARPTKIIMPDGYFLEWPLATVLAGYIATLGNVYMSEHTPFPDAPEKKPRRHFGFVPGLYWYWFVLPLRARAYLSRCVLVSSNGLKQWIVRNYGYPPDKIVVLPPGLETSRFHPAEDGLKTSLRDSLGIPRDALLIVSTARFDGNKRVDRIIKAFDSLTATREDLWLLLAGEGPRDQEVRSLAHSSRASGRIKFLGQLKDVAGLLQASDIFVLSSRFEALSLALLEAMATGLVCVATRTQGPPEIVNDGVNGFLVDNSSEGVLQGLRSVLAMTEQERMRMGRLARQRIEANHLLEANLKNVLRTLGIPATDSAICK